MVDAVFNERQSLRLRCRFTDAAGLPVEPEEIVVRVDNVDTGEPVVAPTVVEAPAAEVFVLITRDQNALQSPTVQKERRLVTVDFSYDEGAQGAPVQYAYTLRNLRFVP